MHSTEALACRFCLRSGLLQLSMLTHSCPGMHCQSETCQCQQIHLCAIRVTSCDDRIDIRVLFLGYASHYSNPAVDSQLMSTAQSEYASEPELPQISQERQQQQHLWYTLLLRLPASDEMAGSDIGMHPCRRCNSTGWLAPAG